METLGDYYLELADFWQGVANICRDKIAAEVFANDDALAWEKMAHRCILRVGQYTRLARKHRFDTVREPTIVVKETVVPMKENA